MEKELLDIKLFGLTETTENQNKIRRLTIIYLLLGLFLGMLLSKISYFEPSLKYGLLFISFAPAFMLLIFRDFFMNLLFKNDKEVKELKENAKEMFGSLTDENITFIKDNYKKISNLDLPEEEFLNIVLNIDKYKDLFLSKEVSLEEKIRKVK